MIRRWLSRRWLVLVALGVVITGVLGSATSVYAHSELVLAQPGPGAIISTWPSAVALQFNEPVASGPNPIRVLDAAGRRADTGAVESRSGGAVLRAPLRDGAGRDGTYVVVWRVTSPDGHPIQGAYTFSVGAPSISGADSDALVSRHLAQSGSSVAVGVVIAIGRTLAFCGLALLIGVMIAATTWARALASTRACTRTVMAGAALTAIGTATALLGQGSYAAGLAIGDLARLDLLRDVLTTRYGIALVVRLGLVGLAGVWWWWARGNPSTLARRLSGGGVVLALALTVSFAGHAATGPMPVVGVVLDVVHVVAMAAWAGGLVVLVVAALRAEPVAWPALQAFSRLALIAFGVIALSGAAQGWRQLGSIGAITDTAYGQALIVKVMVVACVLPLAAYARDLLRRRDDDEVADGPRVDQLKDSSTPHVDDDSDVGLEPVVVARRLRRSVGIEVVFLVVVLALTSILVNTVPGREVIAAPALVQMADATVRIEGTVSPAALGPNEVHLSAFTPQGIPFDINTMSARLVRADIGALDIPLRRLTPGHYYSPQFVIPRKGTWTLVVTTDVDAFTRNTQQTVVNIR